MYLGDIKGVLRLILCKVHLGTFLGVWVAKMIGWYFEYISRGLALYRWIVEKWRFWVPWDVQLYRDYGFFDFRLETIFYRARIPLFSFTTVSWWVPGFTPNSREDVFGDLSFIQPYPTNIFEVSTTLRGPSAGACRHRCSWAVASRHGVPLHQNRFWWIPTHWWRKVYYNRR